MPLHVGFLELEIFLPGSGSLKERRRVVRSLVERLRSRHNVAVIEVSEDGLHQRAGVALVSLASSRDPVERLFDRIVEEAERAVPGTVREVERELLS